MPTSTMPQKKQQSGSRRKQGATFIAAWMPDDILAAMDAEIRRTDTDRSKFIRKAVRNALRRPA